MPFEPALDVTAEASVRIGRTLRNKWHLDALIDVGGMAAVYAATHRNGMRGAVKILHRHRSLEPETAARFRREGFIANKVAHPNAVRVLDDDTDDDGSVFLVMELLEGSTLRDRAGASGGTLTAAEVLLAVDQLLDVLAVAHDASIIHRDIKPDNVFVTTDGQVKMLDFGIAKLFDPAAKHSETVTGLPMGSPAFMSPEQARGRWDIVDVQSDVWSVGATMFTLLSGKDVHTADTVPELLAAIFTKPAPPLASVIPDSHPAVASIVDRALQLRLADRWPDARTMRAAVQTAYLAMYGSALPGPPQTVRAHDRNVSQHDIAPESHVPVTVATTAIVGGTRTVVAHRYARRIAMGSALVLAGALGTAGAARDGRDDRVAGTTAPLAQLDEIPAGSPTILAPPSPATVPRDVSLAPTPPPPLASSAAPLRRVHRRSVYDRRY